MPFQLSSCMAKLHMAHYCSMLYFVIQLLLLYTHNYKENRYLALQNNVSKYLLPFCYSEVNTTNISILGVFHT